MLPIKPLSVNFTKYVKQTQTIRRQFADELFERDPCGLNRSDEEASTAADDD